PRLAARGSRLLYGDRGGRRAQQVQAGAERVEAEVAQQLLVVVIAVEGGDHQAGDAHVRAAEHEPQLGVAGQAVDVGVDHDSSSGVHWTVNARCMTGICSSSSAGSSSGASKNGITSAISADC